MPTAIAFALIATAPWLSKNIRPIYPAQQKPIVLLAPIAMGKWHGPNALKPNEEMQWHPQFLNASSNLQVTYFNNISAAFITLYSAYYRSDQSVDALLNPQNKLFDASLWTKVTSESRKIPSIDKSSLTVVETILERNGTTQLIWSWYFAAGVSAVDMKLIKMLDEIRLISRYADGSGIIALSTHVTGDIEQARERLSSFLKEMYPALDILEKPEKVS